MRCGAVGEEKAAIYEKKAGIESRHIYAVVTWFRTALDVNGCCAAGECARVREGAVGRLQADQLLRRGRRAEDGARALLRRRPLRRPRAVTSHDTI